MGTHFTLALRASGRTETKRTKNGQGKMKTGLRQTTKGALLLGLLMLLLSVYLYQVTGLSTKGYEIRELETRMTELKERQKRLELEAAQLKSIQNIEQRAQTLNLVPSRVVKHLPGSDFAYQE